MRCIIIFIFACVLTIACYLYIISYNFLIDALRVQRASGAFSLEGTEEERDDFIRRLDAFAAQRTRAQNLSIPEAESRPLNPREPSNAP